MPNPDCFKAMAGALLGEAVRQEVRIIMAIAAIHAAQSAREIVQILNTLRPELASEVARCFKPKPKDMT